MPVRDVRPRNIDHKAGHDEKDDHGKGNKNQGLAAFVTKASAATTHSIRSVVFDDKAQLPNAKSIPRITRSQG